MILSTRARGVAATAAAAFVLLTACGSDPVDVPESLLSAKTVGGDAIGDARDHLGGNAGVPDGTPEEQCSLDGADLTRGAGENETMAYRRTVDGHHEVVVIEVQDTTLDTFTAGRKQIESSLAGPGCRRPPTIDAAAVDLGLDQTTAFSSARFADTKDKANILRSYTYVHDNGQMRLVLVSIERNDGTSPSTRDLKKLAAAQIHKTTTELTG